MWKIKNIDLAFNVVASTITPGFESKGKISAWNQKKNVLIVLDNLDGDCFFIYPISYHITKM